MRNIENVLEERGLCYDESHFWNNEIIGKEIIRFNWRNMLLYYQNIKIKQHKLSVGTSIRPVIKGRFWRKEVFKI